MLKVGATPQMIDGVFATFLHRYAKLYPAVQIKVTEAVGQDLFARLERGDLNLGIGSPQLIQTEDHPFGSAPLPALEFLAACHTSLALANTGDLEISRLAHHSLLLLDPSFVVRTMVDAACRLAGFRPTVATESRSPHALLSLAEAGHGVAVVPSVLPTHRYRLRIFRLTHRRRPLRMTMAVTWDRRRLLPRYADDFCKSLAAYLRDVLPISRPSPLGRVVKSDGSQGDEPRPAQHHCRPGDHAGEDDGQDRGSVARRCDRWFEDAVLRVHPFQDLKILVSAVQSRPCPPFLSGSSRTLESRPEPQLCQNCQPPLASR